MKPENKILACVDQSHYADHVADYAAWVATRMELPLEFLHILDRHPERSRHNTDHSGAIGFNAQKVLMDELSKEDEDFSRQAREGGRLFLNRLRERAIAAGVEAPDVRQRHGALVDTLIEQEEGVRMFILGRRGQSAETTPRDLGRNVENVVRALHSPILTITDDFKAPQQVMMAFDGGSMSRKGVEMIAACPLFVGLPIHVITSGEPGKGLRKQLEWAKTTLETAGFETHTALLAGDPESVIASQVKERSIDMLIMGSYTHSPLRSWLFGSTTNDLLQASIIPTLLLR
ncbi:universal stress protein [Thiothrix winogradskyi]|uniref:Universal stress protein n=1 Tax=Thiothrix winogradskyi TaxID=96472 RepID=A0ABY3T4W4_9GAMM|nr:universal stress protein [Thiothrix winogradskyi]UJS26350.1 universal stress protein [Thiothrix winogradskyi]